MARQIQGDAALNGVAKPQIAIESNSSVEDHCNSHCQVNHTKPAPERFTSFHLILHW